MVGLRSKRFPNRFDERDGIRDELAWQFTDPGDYGSGKKTSSML